MAVLMASNARARTGLRRARRASQFALFLLKPLAYAS